MRGNGGQTPSFASLCESCAVVPPHLTFALKTFLIHAVSLVVAFLLLGCEKTRSPELFLIPADYEGVVITVWNQPGFPPLTEENGHLVQNYPDDGIIITSTPREFGVARDETFDVHSDGSREFRRVARFGASGESSLPEEPNIQYSYQAFGSDDYWKDKDAKEYDQKVKEAKDKLLLLRNQRSEQAGDGDA